MRIVVILIIITFMNQVDSLVKNSALNRKITSPMKKKRSVDLPTKTSKNAEIVPKSNEIMPSIKNPQNVVYKMTQVSSKAVVAAARLTRGTIMSSVDRLIGQYISSEQIVGKWKLVQEVTEKNGVMISSPASLQFFRDGTVLTVIDGVEYLSDFSFRERSWPRHCSVQFEALAPQLVPLSDAKKGGPSLMSLRPPVKLIYRGYFKKSVFESGVLRMSGTIYRPAGRLFWKGFERCGYFNAVMRKVDT